MELLTTRDHFKANLKLFLKRDQGPFLRIVCVFLLLSLLFVFSVYSLCSALMDFSLHCICITFSYKSQFRDKSCKLEPKNRDRTLFSEFSMLCICCIKR